MMAIKGEKLQKMCTEVSLKINVSLMCFEPVAEFLNGAGQSQLVSQVCIPSLLFCAYYGPTTFIYNYVYI